MEILPRQLYVTVIVLTCNCGAANIHVRLILRPIARCCECFISQALSESNQYCLRNQLWLTMDAVNKETDKEPSHNPSEKYWEMHEASTFSKLIFGTWMYVRRF